MLIKFKMLKMKTFLAFICVDVAFILLINVKMPTIVKMPTTVGILTFISGINFVLSLVEYEKSFITFGPEF